MTTPASSAPTPRLTIVIPTLNRAVLVAKAVQSALAQTVDGIEIIVSDNGSTDDTPRVLAGFRDPRLRHIRHETTMPAEVHGNFLTDQARGEFFLGLSDDDYIEPDFAERVLALLDRHPALAFVYTGCTVHYGEVPVATLSGPEVEPGVDFLEAFYNGRREVCWCSCVTRVSDLRRIGPIPAGRIFGDMFFWTRLALQGDVGCVAAPLSHYTFMLSHNLSSGTPAPAWAAETRLLADEALAGLQVEGLSDSKLAPMRQACRRFVARSTANQFIWNAVRGAARGRLLRDLWTCRPWLAGDPCVWPRALWALLMPRSLTRALVLRAAAARGRQRGAG